MPTHTAGKPILTVKLLAVLILGLAAAPVLFAAPALPDPSHPLTLIRLTDIALQNNPRTRVAWLSVRSSEAGLDLARAGYWPRVNAALNAQRSRFINFSGGASGAQTRYGPSINLSYLLWDFGARSGALDQAKFALTAARLSQNQVMQDVILSVEQAYYQVLGLEALAEAERQNIKDASTSLDAARQRQTSGLATIGDVYQAEAAVAGARLSLQQTEGQLANAQGQLATATGYPANTKLPLIPLQQIKEPTSPPERIGPLLAAANKARPELLAAKAREHEAAAKLVAVRGQGLPSLNLSANASRTTTVGIGSSSSYSAQLNLNIPLFAGFGDEAANRQAQVELETARANLDLLRQQIELEVWQAYQNVHTAVVSVSTTETQLKSAKQAAEVVNARYKTGLDSILDVLSAQATLANARVQRIQANLNWYAALAALGHAVGGLSATGNPTESP